MPAIKIGNVSGAIYQSSRPLHLNPDGSAQGSLTYKCTTESSFAVIPEYLTPHPFLPALKCYESDLDQEDGGVIRITSIYKGVLADNPEELAQHEFGRTTTEAPIETHPLFYFPISDPPVSVQELAAIELALQNATDLPDTIEGAARMLYDKKRRSIETFLKPGGIYKKSYVSADIPEASLIQRVGYIYNPEAPAPTPPSGQNYLCIGISWIKTAGVVTISEEYQLSGPGGWDTDLYETA